MRDDIDASRVELAVSSSLEILGLTASETSTRFPKIKEKKAVLE